MKKLLFLLPALVLGLATVQAQNYAPFRMGRTPFFQSGDSIYSLRVIDAYAQGADSVFVFNPRAVQNNNSGLSGCNFFGEPAFFVHTEDNAFGKQMIKKPNGDYQFIFSQGDTFLLKPAAPVGQSWTFSESRQLTASLMNRYYSVGSAFVDSVSTISVPGVGLIRIGKNFGLLEAPGFHSLIQPLSSGWTYHLHTLEGANQGSPVSSPFYIYDFQAGDKFLYDFGTSGGPMMAPCSTGYKTVEVLSRYTSPAADSVVYRLKTQTATYYTGNCNGQTGAVLSPFDTVNFVVTTAAFPHLFSLRQEYLPFTDSVNHLIQPFNTGQYLTDYNNRIGTHFRHLGQDTCGQYYFQPPAVGGTTEESYAIGLGQVFASFYQMYGGLDLYNSSYFGLQAYIKGTETYGNWQPLELINATPELQQNLPLQVFPNPFISEITVQLPEGNAGPAEITVFNLQGQRVPVQQVTDLPAQTRLKVALPALPAGLYLLQVRQAGKTFSAKIQRQ